MHCTQFFAHENIFKNQPAALPAKKQTFSAEIKILKAVWSSFTISLDTGDPIMKKESTASDDLFDLLFVAQDIDGQNVIQMNTELSLCPQAAKAQYID